MNLDNPFKILGVGREVETPEILMRTAKCLKERPHEIKKIGEAQKSLLDPKKRAAAEFLCFIDLPGELREVQSLEIQGSLHDSSGDALNFTWLDLFHD